MKIQAVEEKISLDSTFGKALHFGKLITLTGSAQIIVQGITFICGILIIRMLPTDEYALYTIANTLLATMIVLADSGIAAGVMAEGGKYWTDKQRLGSVIVTGLNLRRKFSFVSLAIALPLLAGLLLHHGSSVYAMILIVVMIVPAFYTTLSKDLLEIPFKLKQEIADLQKLQALTSIFRLVLLVPLVLLLPFSFAIISLTGITQLRANQLMRKKMKAYADLNTVSNDESRKRIISIVKRHLPSAVYYCLSGQITIWLISLFGTTKSLAEVGALSRLVMALGILSIVFSTIITPRFARMKAERTTLLKRFVHIQSAMLGICLLVISGVYLFSDELLWLLGPTYSNLNNEIVLLMIAGCLNMIAESTFGLYMSRGWVINPVTSISVNIAMIVAGLLMINITTLTGVLKFNIFIAAMHVVMNSVYAVYFIRKKANGILSQV